MTINLELKQLNAVSCAHQFNINPLKSTVLIFGKFRHSIQDLLKIAINDNVLPCTKVARNLGLELDTDLHFKTYVNKCLKRTYSNLKMLFPNRHIIPRSSKILLKDMLALSHFNFCDIVYGPCLNSEDSNRIQRIQKCCLRFYRSNIHNVNARFRGLISPPTHRTAMFRRSYSYSIYFLYNNIPSNLKMLSLYQFKKSYKKLLFERFT